MLLLPTLEADFSCSFGINKLFFYIETENILQEL